MKIWLRFLLLAPLLLLNSCGQVMVVPILGSRVINVKVSFSSIPEKKLNVYMAEGKVVGGYKEISSGVEKGQSVEYGEKKYIGITPLEKTFTFRTSGNHWKPPQYAVYFSGPNSEDTSVSIGPWGFIWADPGTGKTKEIFYNLEEFPLNYFQTHPNIKEFTITASLNIPAE